MGIIIMEEKKLCDYCGADIKTNDHFCWKCGSKSKDNTYVCDKCGAKVEEHDLFCRQCGDKFEVEGDEFESVEEYVNCDQCGNVMRPTDEHCDFCLKVQIPTRTTNESKIYLCGKCGSVIPPGEDRCWECREQVGYVKQSSKIASNLEPKVNNKVGLTGLILGILSAFFYFIGIIPIMALIISAVGLGTFDSSKQKNRWQPIVGLIFGVAYTFMYLMQYGYIQL